VQWLKLKTQAENSQLTSAKLQTVANERIEISFSNGSRGNQFLAKSVQ